VASGAARAAVDAATAAVGATGATNRSSGAERAAPSGVAAVAGQAILVENANTAKKLGFSNYRQVLSDTSAAADARAAEQARGGKPLWRRGLNHFSESWCLARNWISLSAAGSAELALPPEPFVTALGLTPEPVATPVSPFFVPDDRGCSARAAIDKFAARYGGDQHMGERLHVGQLLEYVIAETDELHLPEVKPDRRVLVQNEDCRQTPFQILVVIHCSNPRCRRGAFASAGSEIR